MSVFWRIVSVLQLGAIDICRIKGCLIKCTGNALLILLEDVFKVKWFVERKLSFTANISVWSGKKLTNLRKAIWKHSGVQGKYSCLFTKPTAIKTYFSPQNSLKDFPWEPTINTQNKGFSIDTIPNYPSPNRYYITIKRLFARGRSLLSLSVK